MWCGNGDFQKRTQIEAKMANLQWYGYEHVNGTYHLKRFLDDISDVYEAAGSDFVVQVAWPFEAENREDALRKLKNLLSKKLI